MRYLEAPVCDGIFCPNLAAPGLCSVHVVGSPDSPPSTSTSSASSTTPPTAATPSLAHSVSSEFLYLPLAGSHTWHRHQTLADSGGAASKYDEPAAPPTDGGDAEGGYESSEVGGDADGFDFLGHADLEWLLATSVPLPNEEGDNGLEEYAGEADLLSDAAAADGDAAPSTNGREPGFSLPDDPTWQWASEAEVAEMIQRQAPLEELIGVFPQAQRMTALPGGAFQCNAKAAINKAARCWEASDCGKREFIRKSDYRRHLKTRHLGEQRAEEKKAQPRASTSKPRARSEIKTESKKRSRRDHDEYVDESDQSDDRKGKKARHR